MSLSRNLIWIDIAKGLAVVLMVYGHVTRGLFSAGMQAENDVLLLVDSVIYSFHMPMFFFLSGVFFVPGVKRYGLRGFSLKKIDSLFYPFVVWSLLQGSAELIFSGYKNHGTSWGAVLSFFWNPRNQLWFLYALLSISVFAVLLYKLPAWGRLGLSVLMYFFAHASDLPLFVAYISGFSVYFFLGSFIAGRSEWVSDLRRWGWFFVFAALVLQYVFHGVLGWNYREGGFLLLPVAISSLLAIVHVSRLLERGFVGNWIAFLGRHSMAIFLGHVIVLAGVRTVLLRALSITSFEIHVWLGVVLAVLLPLLMVWGPLRSLFSPLLLPPKQLSLFRVEARYFCHPRI